MFCSIAQERNAVTTLIAILATWVWPTTHQMKCISFKFHSNLKLHGNEASSSVSLQICISTHHSQIESEAGRVKLLACRLITKPRPRMLPNKSWIYEVMNLWLQQVMSYPGTSWTAEKWEEPSTIFCFVFAHTHTHLHTYTHTHSHTYTNTHKQ